MGGSKIGRQIKLEVDLKNLIFVLEACTAGSLFYRLHSFGPRDNRGEEAASFKERLTSCGI